MPTASASLFILIIVIIEVLILGNLFVVGLAERRLKRT